MLLLTSDFVLFYLNIFVLYIGVTVAHRFYKYVCIHYILMILLFFTADEVNIIY